jgi:TRAP transporter TAXI family solute receptor
MKNKVLLISLALVLIVSLGAFGACGEEEEGEEVWEWPEMFTIATSAIGSSDYAELTALAPIIEQDTGMKLRIVPEESIPLKARWVGQGLFDCTTQSAGEVASFCMEAKGGYLTRDGGPFQIRSFGQTIVQTFGIMVRGDSEIRTIYDIEPGTKMSVWTMPGGLEIVQAVLAWVNLTTDDVILVETGSYPDNMYMIADGRADVCCLALPSSSTVQELEAGPHGLHWLDLNSAEDPEGAARFNTVLPCHQFAPVTIGVPSSIGHWGWGSPALLWTSADTDDELIYQLTKWLDENFDAYKDLHPNLADMSLERYRLSLDTAYLPVHEGTIRYLEEKGMWTEDDDVRQAYNIDLIASYCEAYEAAIDLADAEGIKVDPDSEEWVELWEDYKEEIGLPIFKVIYEF